MILKKLFEKYNIVITKKQENTFENFFIFLVEYNKNVNLTALTSHDDVLVKHFLDSILIFKDQNIDNLNILDLGAGAGFPSIPNAILNPNTKFTIIETLNKRCVFLNLLVEKLNLNNVEIICKRGEDIFDYEVEKFDITCARAVAKSNILLELLAKYTKIDGLIILPKATLEEVEKNDAKNAAIKLKLKYLSTLSYEFENNNRNNLVFKKINKTPKIYPRNFGQIKKSPLR